MDIHRCRFVPYQPEAINALSFSHTSRPKQNAPKDLRLALGRQNGDIEIWNPLDGEWLQERIFRGSAGRTIEQLHWTQEVVLPEEDAPELQVRDGSLRLYSSGGSSSITEWDIAKGVPLRHADSNSKDIWCFAPQPQWTDSNVHSHPSQARAAPAQLLAAGCADGSIVLFSTADGDLRFDRVLTRPQAKMSRCICITWRDRNTVVAGFEESVIRVFDVRNRQIIRTLTVGKSRDISRPLVWAVKCLPNGTILSGDSTGELKIWDSRYFSLAQRLKTHNADILDIATNASGTMILTCGVDRRTVAYGIRSRSHVPRAQSWHEIRHRRFHEHDVKAMSSFESKTLNVVVSGGIDTIPVVLPLRDWNQNYHRSLSHLPQRPQISVSSKQRLMLTWWARDVFVWHIPSSYQSEEVSSHNIRRKLLTQIRVNCNENITSAAISSSGTMIVAATVTGVHFFQIRQTASKLGSPEIKSRPIELPPTITEWGANLVGFSPDGKWIYTVRLNNVLTLTKITSGTSPRERPVFHKTIVKLDRRKRKLLPQTNLPLSEDSRHIYSVAFSLDSRILATGDLSGAVDTWTLQGKEETEPLTNARNVKNGAAVSSDSASSNEGSDSDSDSEDETSSSVVQGQKWVKMPAGSQLPSLESTILAMTFKPYITTSSVQQPTQDQERRPSPQHNVMTSHSKVPPVQAGMLIVVTANHQIVEFDVVNCRLSDWSRRNSKSMLPEDFRRIKDRVMGSWVDYRPSRNIYRLWLYGPSFIYMLDLNVDLSTQHLSPALVKVGRLGKHVLEAPSDHTFARLENDSTANEHRKKRKRSVAGAGDEMNEKQSYSASAKSRVIAETSDALNDDRLLQSPVSDTIDYNTQEMDIDSSHGKGNENGFPRQRMKVQTPGQNREESVSDKGKLDKLTSEQTSPTSWHTFQYRAIYGIGVFAHASTNQGHCFEVETAPEIVLVERPTYDIDLPSRFVGGQDW